MIESGGLGGGEAYRRIEMVSNWKNLSEDAFS
jgi:hypothetical protein